jgi:hypothetical protein
MEFTFEKNATVEAIESVPEQFRGMYSEVDGGGYELSPALKGVAAAIDGLNKANKAARNDAKTARTTLQAELDKWKLLGDDPDAIKTKLEELEAELAKGADGKLNLDKIRKEMGDAHAKELAERDKKLTAMQTTLQKHLVDNEAVSAIAEAKGASQLLLPHVRASAKVIDDGAGGFAVRVLDGEGDVRIFTQTGNPMTIKELVAEMRASEVFGRAFEAEGTGGGGAPAGGAGRPGPKPPAGEKSSIDKIAAGLRKQQQRR